MHVDVTKNETTITYGYDPEHYDEVVKFYTDALEAGEIQAVEFRV